MASSIREATKVFKVKSIFEWHENQWEGEYDVEVSAHQNYINVELGDVAVIFTAPECGDLAKNLLVAASILANQLRKDEYVDMGAQIASVAKAKSFLMDSALPPNCFFSMAVWKNEQRPEEFSASGFYEDPDPESNIAIAHEGPFALDIYITQGYVTLSINSCKWALDIHQVTWLADQLWQAAFLIAKDARC